MLPSGLSANNSGSGPLGSTRVTFSVARSSASMWSLSLAQMNSVLPSLDSTMPRGRSPTAIVSVTFSVCPSTTVIVLSFSLDTRMRSARAQWR